MICSDSQDFENEYEQIMGDGTMIYFNTVF